MRRRFVIALVIIATAAVATSPPRILIEKNVEQLVALFSDGIAISDPQYWHIEFGKVFGSDREDAVAVFSIEGFHGGNDDHQYLAFFESIEPDKVAGSTSRLFRLVAVTQIGGRTWREFDCQKMKLGPNFVTLSGKKYGQKDAACCPSVPIQVTFQVKSGVISESK